MGSQRSRWRCPKRDGPGQIEELAVEIGLRFVNRMSHLATPDAFESRNHSHSTRFEMPRLEDLWDMEQYFKAVRAPFLLTTKSQWQQSISLGMRSCGGGRDMRTCWRAVARSTPGRN